MPALFLYLIAAAVLATGAIQAGAQVMGHVAGHTLAATAAKVHAAPPRLVEVRRAHGCYVGSCF